METYHLRKGIHRLPGKVIHAIPLPKPDVTEGLGSRRQVGEICRKCGYKHALVVTDRTLSQLGYDKAVVESLEAAGVGCTLYNDIHSEPTVAIIDEGRQQALTSQTECIIALGGGSVMDSCKMIAASVKTPRLSVSSLLLKFLPVAGGTLPVIMIPSTAGTGAEMTVGAVVTNDKGAKGSTVLIGLNVPHVLLDSELTMRAPEQVTAACAIDALSHCVEGVVSDTEVNAEDMYKSLEGVRLIMQNLPIVMKEPENNEARLAMARAAMYGGNAINTQLAGYVHAFAHSIGALYHLPHGVAISLMLMPILEFQKEACQNKYAMMAQYCGVPDFLQAVRDLLKVCAMDQIVSPIKAEDHKKLIRMVAADSVNYSAPVTFANKDIEHILKQLTL